MGYKTLPRVVYSNFNLLQIRYPMNTGSTEVGPRFDKQGTFLPHSVLGPTQDYASELKNTGRVRLTYMHNIIVL